MVYVKTALGVASVKDRSAAITPGQRSAFIMFDGKRDASEVLRVTAGIGVVQADLDYLVSLGLLADAQVTAAHTPVSGVAQASETSAESVTTPPSGPLATPLNAGGLPTLSAQARYSAAYPIATRLTASLGLRGFRLNLAVEAAGDLDKLRELAPRIKDAVGAEKYQPLDNALYD